MAYRFHLIGLAHLPCSREYMACAFTQKNYKLAEMLTSLGHEVIYYGAEGSDLKASKIVVTHTLKDLRRDYGDGDNRFDIGYDWKSGEFRHDFNAKRQPSTLKFYTNAIVEITARKKSDDFLLLSQGAYHKPIADAAKLYLTCEPGIGYRGSYARFRAFESSYLMNFTYGSEHPRESINGHYYDRVIPNYFEPQDFEPSSDFDDYYLYIGRLILRKGIKTAQLVCDYIGKKLLIVGQGGTVDGQGRLHGDGVVLPKGTWEYYGYAGVEERKRLLARAIATFVPTLYLEPFAGTHIESMLSGTPPITTNFGVFPETIPDAYNGNIGFRCNTLQDFVDAALKAPELNRSFIHLYAQRYLTTTVKYDYQKWFDDLYQQYLSTTGKGIPGWHHLRERG